MKSFNFYNIDVSADAVVMGNALQEAVAQGIDPQAFLQGVAQNSMRPYVDPAQPDKAYVTVNTGIDKDSGKPIYKAVCVGNADTVTLYRGEWEAIDKRVRRVATQKMQFVAALEAAGLSIPLDGMGVTRYTWRNVGQFGEARVDMDLTANVNDDSPQGIEESLPIPFISSGWDVSARQLEVSRRGGMPIDTEKAYWASYAVARATENLFLNGNGVFKADNNTIYGIRTTPASMAKTLQKDWTDDTVTGEMIVDEVNGWLQDLRNQFHSGPFNLIYPDRYSYKLNKDYKAEVKGSILARIKELQGIGSVTPLEILNVDPTDATKYMNEVFLLEMQQETCAVLNGMNMTNLQWQKKGPLVMGHLVAQIKVPLFRADIEGQTGLLRATCASTAKA